MSSLSAWFVMYFVFPLCIFKPAFRLSQFRLFKHFSVCFVVSLKRATSSANTDWKISVVSLCVYLQVEKMTVFVSGIHSALIKKCPSQTGKFFCGTLPP